MSDFGTCRSCRAQVRWAKSAKTGKPMPLDRDPERGNVLLDGYGKAHVFSTHGAAMGAVLESDRFGSEVFISHHASCPNAAQHRPSRKAEPDALF